MHVSCHKPRREFEFSLWMRKVIMELNSWMIERQNKPGNVRLWQQQKETQTSPKSFPLKQIFSNHITKGEFLTNPCTCPWLIGSIHSHLPVYMAGVSSLFTSQGFFICSKKVIRSGLETTRPVPQRKEYLFCQGFITFQSNMYLGEKRTHGWMLIQPREWFPQILYWKHPYNTNKYIKIRSWDSGQVLQGKSK